MKKTELVARVAELEDAMRRILELRRKVVFDDRGQSAFGALGGIEYYASKALGVSNDDG